MESMQDSLRSIGLNKHGIVESIKEKCTVCNYGSVITVVLADKTISRCKYCDDKELARKLDLPTSKHELDTRRMKSRANYFNRIPRDLEDVLLNDYIAETDEQKEIKKIATDFIVDFDKKRSLVISGDPGIGKSHVAVSIAKALSKDYSVLFLKSADVLALIRESFEGNTHSEAEVYNVIKDVDLFVLDDIGAEYDRQTGNESWASDILFRILDSRLGKSVVITTNYTDVDLIKKYGMNGKRIESRMNDNAILRRVVGRDVRKDVYV